MHSKNYHSVPSTKKDILKIQEQLERGKVFKLKERRQHEVYATHQPLLHSINWPKIIDWVKINYLT